MRAYFVKVPLSILAGGALLFGLVASGQNQIALGAPATIVSIDIALEPGEFLTGSAVGHLEPTVDAVLVFGTFLPNWRGHVFLFRREGSRYVEAWRYTNESGAFSSARIVDRPGSPGAILVTEWVVGQGGYGDVRVFEWSNGTYRELWNLGQLVDGGQITRGARLIIERIDLHGNIQMVVRAPYAPGEPGAYLPSPHQVSIYRWDAKKQTFTLFQRFIDAKPSWE